MQRYKLDTYGSSSNIGSILNLCEDVASSAGSVSRTLHAEITSEAFDVGSEELKLLLLYANHAAAALRQCQSGTQLVEVNRKIAALKGEVEFIQEKGKELDRQKEAVKALQQKGELSSFYRSMMRLQCFPGKSPLQLAVQDFQLAEDRLQDAIRSLKEGQTDESEYHMFCAWLPPAISDKEALYSPPVAFDTVMSSLLSDRLPARILIHGAPGNGKTRMLKQIQLALESKAEDAHQQLAARFPDGMIWVDCGLSLQVKFPQFSLDIRAKALTLARELLVDDEEMYLDSMDLSGLSSIVKTLIAETRVLVVFDDVWDGTIFRRDCFDILADFSTETISIPLSSESNSGACLKLLTTLVTGTQDVDALPVTILPFAKKLVKECEGSPLAIKLLAPLLSGSLKGKRWKDLCLEYAALIESPTLRRDSLSGRDGSDPSRVLFAYQLRCKTLPRALHQMLSVLALFPATQKIPAGVLAAIYMQSCDQLLSVACVALRALTNASFIQVTPLQGQLLHGSVTYHPLLKSFLNLSPDFTPLPVPGTASPSSSLVLALVTLYASPTYRQQALQVFSKLEQGADCVPWDEAPRNGRNPLFEPFWQQLIALSWDEELGSASQLILISAARQLVNASEVSQALATLFGSSRSLYAAAGVFSELAWQIQDRAFLEQVTQRLQDAQAVSRVVIRLRVLIAENKTAESSGELAVMAWTLADLADYLDTTAKLKLQGDPIIAELDACHDGVASFAYQRLAGLLNGLGHMWRSSN